MKDAENKIPEPGDIVVLRSLHPGLLTGLPTEEQEALIAAVGKPVLLLAYDDAGRAELEFKDRHGVIHFIYVSPEAITVFK